MIQQPPGSTTSPPYPSVIAPTSPRALTSAPPWRYVPRWRPVIYPDFSRTIEESAPASSMSSARLEVRLPDRLSSRLEDLASSEGVTKTDVFRRALALYLLVKDREEAGATLQFVRGDQRETLVSI